MHWSANASLALSLVACGARRDPPPPEPATVRTPATVPATLQLAAQELVGAGFTITVSDAATGVLTATRARAQAGNNDFLRCVGQSGSAQATNRVSVLTVTVAARAGDAGTSVRIASSTRTTYPNLTGGDAIEPSDTDCVSREVIERRIATVVQSGTPTR